MTLERDDHWTSAKQKFFEALYTLEDPAHIRCSRFDQVVAG